MNDIAHPDFYTFVLCGGSGPRLWPLNVEQLPRQLIPRSDDRSLLQNALLRLRNAGALSDAVIVCHEAHRFIAGDQLEQIGIRDVRLMLEPCWRNTAPAIAAAALMAVRYGDDPIMLVVPATRPIGADEELGAAFAEAAVAAGRGALVVFGATPTAPLCKHGYIKTEPTLQAGLHDSAMRVAGFVDRPTLARAQKLVAQADHLWNTGMFCFKASVILSELRQKAPRLLEQVRRAVRSGSETRELFRLDLSTFCACGHSAIDEIVMESSLAVVIPLNPPPTAPVPSRRKVSSGSDASQAVCVHD